MNQSIYLFRPTIESDIKSFHGKDTDQDGIQLLMYGKEGGLKATYPRLGTYETLSTKNPMELDARSDSKGEGMKNFPRGRNFLYISNWMAGRGFGLNADLIASLFTLNIQKIDRISIKVD